MIFTCFTFTFIQQVAQFRFLQSIFGLIVTRNPSHVTFTDPHFPIGFLLLFFLWIKCSHVTYQISVGWWKIENGILRSWSFAFIHLGLKPRVASKHASEAMDRRCVRAPLWNKDSLVPLRWNKLGAAFDRSVLNWADGTLDLIPVKIRDPWRTERQPYQNTVGIK